MNKDDLIKTVKAVGQEVIDRAEDLVGEGDMLSDFDIWLRFPQGSVPTIELSRTHVSKKVVYILAGNDDERN